MSFKQANHSVAKDHLQRAISNCESKETKAEATYWLARVFVYANDNERALELLKTIVNLDIPEELRVAVLYDGAVAASKAGDDSLALRWLAVIRKRYPKNQLADSSIRMEIDIHQRRGESDKALVLIKRFRNEHKQSPMRTSVLESEGRSHYAEKRYEEMIQTFELLLAETRGDKTIEPADRANWRYLKSLGYLGLNDYEQAEVELNRIDVLAQSRQLKPLVQIALATSRFRAKKYSAAILNYREYLRLSESGAEQKRARAELTICLAYAGRWDEAADAFEDLNVHHADDPMLFATMKFLAERSYYEKKLDHAQRWFTLMSRPGNPKEMITSGLSGLAWISVKSQDLQSANDVFERLLNECPDEKSSGDAALARAKFLEDQKDFEQAAITYGLVIRQIHAPELSSVAKLRRAYCLQKMGGIDHLEESKTLLQDYLALPSANPLADEAMYQLAWVLHDLGQPDECYKMFKELVESEPASKYWPDAAYRVIKDAISKRDLETAKSLSAKLLSRSDVPDEVTSRVLFVQGQIAVQENQWSGVAKSMRELASRTDDDKLKSKAEYWLAESLYRQKKYEDALKIYERLASPVGMIDKKLEPWLLLRTAQCQGQADDWSSAMSSATKAKKRFPDFESNYEFDFIHGRGLEDAGKLTDAREAYQLVIDSTKGGSTETAAIAQWRIGETYFHQEDYVNAIKSYHKVDSLFSYGHWRSAALFQAGKCQEHLKNDKHAIKLYTQLIESFPDSSFAAGARKRLDRLTAQAKAMTTGTTAETNPGKNRR